MATWSRSKRWIEVHEWFVPSGCWNQLAQAIDDAVKSYAGEKRILVGDVSDNSVLFKPTDEGVIVYYEIERTSKKPSISDSDPWRSDEPPF